MDQATGRLVPPFSKEVALLRDVRRVAPFLDTGKDTTAYLRADLQTPRLDKIYSFLWLAGLPRPARPLHRQNLLMRTIYLTENPDEHLVWHDASIFIKPVPAYLLDNEFWEQELCNDVTLYESAYGLLVSYVWLVRHPSDLRVASGAGLLPADIDWNDWVAFVTHLNLRLDSTMLCNVDRRYRYGELRLSRLNTLYRLGLAGFSLRNVVYGFMSGSVRYTTFFERNFGWILAVFVYVTVVLSAMQVALATDKFSNSDNFQQFSYGPPGSQSARDRCLVLDDAFLGITPLFDPQPEDHKVDIIAISGLGGHAFGSFKERDGDHMWLRDSLPYDLTREDTLNPMARVMVYGYESSVANSNSFQNLEDLATSFHHSLLALAHTPTTRPIIFIAHSLGGLIIKETLITLSKSKNEDDLKLAKAVYGIVFFGVPHDGMDISSLIPMVENGPNRFLVESIGRINSQILNIQRREFHTALGGEGDSEIICFYETEESRTAQKDKHGNWTMQGPRACLVTKSSATRCRSWEDGPEHTCAIARTHSDMVKFSRQDHEYDKSRERLRGLARRALMAQHRKRSAGAKFVVPYIKNPDYVNRSATWEKLKTQLGFDQRPGAADARQRVSLFGLGGVGKTQIALAYVYWLREEFPDVSVFWVHASTEERFRQSYASIAEECDIPGRDDTKLDLLMLVKAWLEKKLKAQWLMVIDNADDAQLFFPLQQNTAHRPNEKLGRYIPECAHGSILVTTRNKKAGLRFARGKPPIEVGNMTSHETNQLIRRMLENNDIHDEEIFGLATRLENLPLALAQAAAFIHENGIAINDYIGLLDASDAVLVDCLSEPFEAMGRDSDTPHAVTATWIISFEQIEKQDRFTGEVLSLISLFDRQAIPREFITGYWQKKWERVSEASESFPEAKIIKALGTLQAFCFISEAKDQSLDMHRLVQLVTRKWLAVKGNMTKYAQQALTTVSGAFPYGRFETREVCLKYLPHAHAVLINESTSSRKERACLLHRMAGYFDYEGHWEEAEQYGIGAVELRIEILGEEHPDTLKSMGNLASTYRNQGRWKEAEELEVDVMEIRKRVLGEEHPSTLTSMGNLASTYRNQGRWKEAEELEVDVMEITKRVLGEEHPNTLTSMGNLASTYRNQGRLKEAEELEVDVMEIRKRVLGEEHPDTLTSMSNLASTYWDQGRWKEAEELEVDVMEIRKRVLGEEHPDTLTSMGNLASTYCDQGRWKEAEELEVDVMEITKRVLGEEHPNTLTSMSNLASTYRNQGRWKEAEELQIQELEICSRVLGEEHPSTLTSMGNLASTYCDQGRWKEAEELEVDVMEITKRVLGEEHPHTLTSMGNLASTYRNQGRWKEAEELQIQELEICSRVLGEEHPSTLTSMGNLAWTYRNQGRLKEAEELQIQELEICSRVLGEEHPSTLTSMGNLASTYRNQGRLKEAEELQIQELEICSRVLGEEHPSTLTSMGNLASTYWDQGRWKEAEELEVDVMEIRKRVLGEEHPDTLTSMSNLAWTYRDQGSLDAAVALMQKCVCLRKRVLGADHPDTISSLTTLARWQE
ncbi:hypothetical protein AU210_014679 [Fusarium oxysporum f. sp. radicis-cucumerinum]|uniref:NB-ARC domain-containing protein n=1 Tax=Fusarium oxysporum f. sp. radicis-cucumerinum TaxID=327505 RepID=A0A2H3FX83_FUSOX|nr:hypothetical protein AU210_014679 [Fusarium oxysporum f. sp. radicis-cucumerinum]